MFGILKRKFKKLVKGITKKIEEKAKKLREKKIEEKDIEEVFSKIEAEFLSSDFALTALKKLKENLKKELVGKVIEKGREEEFILESIKKTLLEPFEKPVKLEEFLKKKPSLFLFFGVNGVGKSLTVAKVGFLLKKLGYKPLLAAGDTFRAAGIEQLEEYAKKAGLPVIKQKRGADSCAVIFDARKAAESRGFDVVLADTSGRMHTKKNLMEELRKIVRVNKPDLKILVLDSLAGNDILNQYEFFEKAVGIDAVVFTKVDINEKGGNIISFSYLYRKPILFLCNGQGLEDIEEFKPEKFVEKILS